MRTRVGIKNYAEQNFKIYILFMILFFTGLSIGAAIVNVISIENCKSIVEPLKTGSGDITVDRAFKVISKTFLTSMKPILFMWVMGFTNFTVYSIIVSVVYKGGILGFVIGVILRVYGLQTGMAILIASILPQNIFYIPILFLMAGFSYKYSLEKKKRVGGSKKIRYLFKLITCAVGCLIVAITDAYITAFLMKTFINGG